MDRPHITPEQAKQVHGNVAAHYRYAAALVARCEANHFPPRDLVFQCAKEAEDKLQALMIHLHYAAVGHKPGERPEVSERQMVAIRALEAVGWMHIRQGPGPQVETCKKGGEWVVIEIDGTVHRK